MIKVNKAFINLKYVTYLSPSEISFVGGLTVSITEEEYEKISKEINCD